MPSKPCFCLPDSFLIIIGVHCTLMFQLAFFFSCFSLVHFIAVSGQIFVVNFDFIVEKFLKGF